MKIFGLKESDEKKLKEGLAELRKLHMRLSSQYTIKSDLVEITDRRYSLRALLDDELNQFRDKKKELEDNSSELVNVKSKIHQALKLISEIENIIHEDDNGASRYKKFLELTDEDIIEDLNLKTNKINSEYDLLFGVEDNNPSKIKQIKDEISYISNEYDKLFDELDENDETKIEKLNKIIEELYGYYSNLFLEKDHDEFTKKEKVDEQLNKIQKFYEKIYGNENKKLPSLINELDERLTNLKNIEERARSVIGLSSEAGLAGGFVQKGKEAKLGQIISIVVFVLIVLLIFGFNFYLFDKKDFIEMSWDTFLFKLLINAPLVWIATIANINLNKFSRLEQEYSHKEALAKSYERYKSEIQELEHLGVEGADELKLKLLEINLEAFKVNPAENSDKSKPDFSIFDLVHNRKKQQES